LRVPRDRNKKFSSSIIPKSEQIDSRLKEDLAVLHLAGISNRTLAMVSKRILGVEVGKDTVHKSLAVVEEKALKWLERDLTKKYWCLFIDGTNFKIQRRGSTEKEPTLVVVGIDENNCTSLLALQPGQKDNAESWQIVFKDLIKRGLNPELIQIGVMDGLPGLEKVFKETFSKSMTGRCWVHAKRNAMAKCSKRLSEAFEKLLNEVMYASSESQARLNFNNLKIQMGSDCERAVHCIEKDFESLLTHYKFEKKFWRVLKTTNPIERVNKELKRRTKSMEGLGEKTLNILLAWTAMRLEYNWLKIPVDSKALNNLEHIRNKNQIEDVLGNLIH
jgi:transposase-like protein